MLAENSEKRYAVLTDTHSDPSPNPAIESELRRLVNLVADAHGFSLEDRAEALEIALRDADRNRALAAECSGTVH